MSSWSLVGRERELAELDRVWGDAVAGAGCLLVLDGAAGVGKTALAVKLVQTAAVTPVWVSCVDQAVPAPQGVLTAMIDGLGLALEPVDASIDADARVVALATAIAATIVDGVDRPRLVVIDDVQWADEVSLRVLALAAPQVGESRVLIVATLRTGEALPPARRTAVATMLRAARRLPVLPLHDEAAGTGARGAQAGPRRGHGRTGRAVARSEGAPAGAAAVRGGAPGAGRCSGLRSHGRHVRGGGGAVAPTAVRLVRTAVARHATSSKDDLTGRGWHLVGHPTFMARAPAAMTPPAGEATVRTVATPEDLRAFEQVVLDGYPIPQAADDRPTLAPSLLDSPVRLRLAYLDGRPVATGASHVAHGVVNLGLAATLPVARRRGAWAAVVSHRVNDNPALPAVAFTSDDSRPGLQRLGFLPITRFTLWARSAIATSPIPSRTRPAALSRSRRHDRSPAAW